MPSRAAALPLSVALAALLAGSLGGCRIDTDGTSLAKHSRDVAYRVNQPVKTLEATSVAGTVEVVGREGTGIAVTEHLRYDDEPPQTRHEVQGDTLVLDSTCPKRNACSVSYRIEVPPATAVNVRSDAGEVRVSGLASAVRVRTSAGVVTGSRLRSPDVNVDATAGEVSLDFVQAPTTVEVHATAGSVTIKVPGDQRYAVDATTQAGSTQISVPQDPASAHRVKVTATAGSVSVLST